MDQTQDRACTSARGDLAIIAGWFIALSAFYWIAVWAVIGRVFFAGFPIDDAFIHLQFARNLFEQGEMAFNPGVPSSGSTAPAFPLLIAACYAIVHNWYAAAHLLCGLCSLGTGWGVYLLLRSWTHRADIARWAGILTVVTSPTIIQAYAGMEAPVYSLILLLGLWGYGLGSRASRWAGSAVFGLLIGFRPEFVLLLPLIVLERLIATRRSGDRAWIRTAVKEVVPIGAVWLVFLAAYGLYHWHQDGHWVPTTFGAKALASFDAKPQWMDGLPAAIRRGDWLQALFAVGGWPFINIFLIGVGLGTLCLPIAFGMYRTLEALWRDDGKAAAGWRLAILILIGYPFLRAIVDPPALIWFQNQRYFAHLTPLFILIALGAFQHTGAIVLKPWWNWRGIPLAIQRRRTIGWALGGSLLMGTMAVLSVGNIHDMQVQMAHWLRERTPEDRLIATNDIGAIGFITRRPVLDTVGLVEPTIVEHYLAGGTIDEYLMRHDPAYVVIFPNWYESFSRRDDLLERVHAIQLDFNVVCGGSEFVAYRPRWSPTGRDAAVPVQ
ncbi:MAG: hypothetical protein ACE5EC_04955 [Phycisphaerae bacterium]